MDEPEIPQPNPTLRPSAPCARCRCREFVVATVRERGESTKWTDGNVAPLGVTYGTEKRGVFDVYDRAKPNDPRGILNAFICRNCGFTELYTDHPGDIPIGPEFGTLRIAIGDDEPYR